MVLGEELELRLERHFLLADALEREPQEIAQPHQRAIGRFHVAVHQRGDRVQRVEEKVRMELLLQRPELRFGELGFEL